MKGHAVAVGAWAASVVATWGLVAGCASNHQAGSGQPSQPSTAVASATADGASVSLRVGQQVDVALPGAAPASGEKTNYAVTPKGSNVLSPVAGSSGSFIGAAPGTAHVVVTQTPACEPGEECPAHIIELGTVTVTVTG